MLTTTDKKDGALCPVFFIGIIKTQQQPKLVVSARGFSLLHSTVKKFQERH